MIERTLLGDGLGEALLAFLAGGGGEPLAERAGDGEGDAEAGAGRFWAPEAGAWKWGGGGGGEAERERDTGLLAGRGLGELLEKTEFSRIKTLRNSCYTEKTFRVKVYRLIAFF